MTSGSVRTVVIMGAGGRDFHDFNTVFRGDPSTRVVAFTAAQIPGIADRTYPPSLAGSRYPDGIPIVAEDRLPDLIRDEGVDEVVLAYPDLSHEQVMHRASIALAAGADFRLLGPTATMLRSTRPVVAVCAVRTGAGKSQTTRRIGQILLDAGLTVALVRHPMPYGDLERMRVQRFASLADIDAVHPTIEEREEYEAPVRMGMVMYAGVDYGQILRRAEQEADIIVWDGGNNDFPFFAPDVLVTVVDPLRPGHELAYHPGETNLRTHHPIDRPRHASRWPRRYRRRRSTHAAHLRLAHDRTRRHHRRRTLDHLRIGRRQPARVPLPNERPCGVTPASHHGN